ncbi:MAG: VCBS repeat-containing protein [Saprospiraceae bacterium]|nr:VCBS repeat-containing protein [Saprospiraceae bacterium]
MKYSWFFFLVLFLISCQRNSELPNPTNALFDIIPTSYCGVSFNNELTFTEEYNPYTFKNFFNGGGVGLGDFNNDNLIDIYFSGNLVDNKLYINQGNFKFKDITASAGVASTDVWSSGVSLVDINADNLLDIYVCKSGKPEVAGNRKNELYINQGDLTFKEEAAQYGLDFEGLAVHAVFFDYDLDGDLDCYLLNNSIRSVGGYDMIPDQRNIPNPDGGNKLLKSMITESKGQEKKYIDVTQNAGIYSSDIGFGLGVSVSDLNLDGWPDIFVSNDFFEKDYLYINNHDGTFQETIDTSMQELSMGSMGADIADLNNDGLQDIFVTEMLPSTLTRIKSKAVFETYDKSQLNFEKGYHRQFGRNALHINAGIHNQKLPLYYEISRFSGTAATEWSWGALIEDFDQDGMKDIFVANGIYKDLLDQDFLNFYNPNQIRKLIQSGEKNAITKMFDEMPSSPYPNVFFKNTGNLKFEDISTSAGFSTPTFSNGSAYADLDNDGDLDLVTNNIGAPASLYRNNSNQKSIVLELIGNGNNTQAIGSKVICYSKEITISKEVYPMKGFESTVDTRVLFPMPESKFDSIIVFWPNRYKTTILPNEIILDSINFIRQPSNTINPPDSYPLPSNPLLKKVNSIISYQHKEDSYINFNNHRTHPFFLSNGGPKLKTLDINGDQKKDLIIGGSKGKETQIFVQKNNRLVQKENLSPINNTGEVTDILIDDFDKNGVDDIYFASGGIEFSQAASGVKDKIYLSKNRKLVKAPSSFINTSFSNSSGVVYIDYDNDGDQDLIISERVKSNAYGIKGDLIVYQNENGSYKKIPPISLFKSIGLVTDLKTVDLDDDKQEELVVACEYGTIKILALSPNGEWLDKTQAYQLSNFSGRWNSIEIKDIDNDGDQDIIALNMGQNHSLSNSSSTKAKLYVNDFDRNGSVETILCVRENNKDYPLTLRDDLLMQLPSLKKKVLSYRAYSEATMQSLFDSTVLNQSIIYELNEFRTGIFMNNQGSFEFIPLPKEAQWTDQYAIQVIDLNGDDLLDIILGGNQYKSKPEFGINAASFGQVFLQNTDGTFIYLPFEKSGLLEFGEIRDLEVIHIGTKQYLLVGKNSSELSTYLLPKN